MRRAAIALAWLLLLVPIVESPAAHGGSAPSWYRHPPAQRGYVLAKASADSQLAALTDAIVALALERSARRRPAPADNEASLESFGAIGVRTTRAVVTGERAETIEKTQATIEMRTATGMATIQWTRQAPIAKSRRRQVKRVFDADMVKTSANDIVAELKRTGVIVRTASRGGRHYVLLKAPIAGPASGTTARR